MPKTSCPRCGYAKASDNARGPHYVHCRQCKGLVPKQGDVETEYIGNNPLHNLIAKERGLNDAGVIRNPTPVLRGGL